AARGPRGASVSGLGKPVRQCTGWTGLRSHARRLPIGDDSVIAAAGALPRDPFVGPHVVLNDAGARTMAGASPAFDLVDGVIVTARGHRGRGHDPSQMLHQPARGARNIRRQVAGLGVDEVTQVGDPGHTLSPAIRLSARRPRLAVFVFSYSVVVRPTF